MLDLTGMTTESRNKNTMELDAMSSLEIVTAMNKEDFNVPSAISKILPEVANVVDATVEAFENNGRLIYIGAGTSGRLGLLDAVECPPTFGVSQDVVIGLIAGGKSAFIKAKEGAEDSPELCVEDLKKINLNKNDIVVGIAASGRTPYVIGGLEYAKSLTCKTAAIACNVNSKVGKLADMKIEVNCGPEILTGSTRLKSGTAQKMILNMISTASMIRTGKAYQNLMVDVMQTNEKLKIRARNIVKTATGVDDDLAAEMLEKANGSAKLAIVMILLDCDAKTASEKLNKAKGHVKEAIKL